uniref:BRL3 n=1 Tax=Arundo donax TaxID=35708 RepID=A0A0A9ASY9_ARUDO
MKGLDQTDCCWRRRSRQGSSDHLSPGECHR